MSDNQQEQGLTLGDRINYPFILANLLLKFGDAIVQPEGNQSEQQVREAALVLFNSIPDQWFLKDKQFRQDVENSILKIEVDNRIEWCTHRVGPPKWRTEEKIQPYRLFNACINVFQRRGLLSKTIYSENIVPTPESLELEKDEDEIQITDKDQEDINKLKKIVNSDNSTKT